MPSDLTTPIHGIARRYPAPAWALAARIPRSTNAPVRRGAVDLGDDALPTAGAVYGAFRRPAGVGPTNLTAETSYHRQMYDEMLRDPYIKSALLQKIWGVAQLELQVLPQDADDERQQKVANFLAWNVEQADDGLRGVVEACCFGPLIRGVGIAHRRDRDELVDRGQWSGLLVLEKLWAKDHHYWDLDYDKYRRITGIIPRRPDPETGNRDVIPRSEFVVIQHLAIYDNPNGMSDFRAACRAYELLDAAMELRHILLQNFTGPFLVAEGVDQSNRAYVLEQFRLARQSRGLTLPAGVVFKAMDLAMKTQDEFASACHDLREEIATAIAGSFLSMMTSKETDPRGDSKVQAGVTDTFVWYLAQIVADALNRDVLPYYTDKNFAARVPYPKARIVGKDPAWNRAQLELGEILRRNQVPTRKSEWYKYSGGWSAPRDEEDTLGGEEPLGSGGLLGDVLLDESADDDSKPSEGKSS